ncbi:aldehyde dehydrogenase family protein [Streptomyces sp. NPDC058239]|uniref:aldehyde dehydrogenase family protein n=1 Tax=unclassified Streptomyces TaxID=2593676 RepID=UPI003650B5F4
MTTASSSPKCTARSADATGRHINEAAARDFKHVSLELGRKTPDIVFADADLEAAVNGTVSGIWSGRQGTQGPARPVHRVPAPVHRCIRARHRRHGRLLHLHDIPAEVPGEHSGHPQVDASPSSASSLCSSTC